MNKYVYLISKCDTIYGIYHFHITFFITKSKEKLKNTQKFVP